MALALKGVCLISKLRPMVVAQGSVIVANKFKHVRASWIASPADASIAAAEDDSNIMCFPSRCISSEDAEE